MISPDLHFAAPSRYAALPPHCRERFVRQNLPERHEGSVPVTTSDGRPLTLRRIEPTDVDALQRGFARLPSQNVRNRFLPAMSELPLPLALRLCRIDPATEAAYVLMDESRQPPEMRGVGRMCVDEATDSAEFSVLVAQPWCGLGLDALLLQRLVDDGRRRGLAELWSFVSAGNQPLLRLCKTQGFQQRWLPERPGTAQVTLEL